MSVSITRVATGSRERTIVFGRAQASPRILVNMGLAGLLFLALSLQLVVRLEIIDQGYRVERLRALVLNSDTVLRELHLEYIAKTRPLELSQRARDELGMVPLIPEQMRQLIFDPAQRDGKLTGRGG